ncbi:MAG TPA: hypothetical protein DCG79_01430, partial [Clostridiales bacterium]|nr:hypothetical protein [Clostridiales bacterium]
DLAVDLYDLAREKLKKAGFHRYEISNFCKKDAVCGYNYSVWQYGEYLGLGLGASSFLRNGKGGVRRKNADDLSFYLATHGVGGVTSEEITELEAMKEFIMLGLRLEEGLNTEDFYAIFGVDFMSLYGEKVKKLGKMLLFSDKNVAIAPEYFYVSNSIIEELIY